MTPTVAAAAPAGDLRAGFPAPPSSGLDLFGPLTLNYYALCIVVGIIAAILLSSRLWKSRGGSVDNVMDATLWAVLLGIVGGRLYHVFSSPDAYFGPNFDGSGDLTLIPQVWLGGLGIWGAIVLGAVGIWIACRRYGIKFAGFADVIVPGVLLGQAIGRWGNWFNQELYGAPTSLPWGLEVDAEHRVPQVQHLSESTLFHPTFLYESLWSLAGVVLLVLLHKKFRFKQGLLAWTYVAYYTLGRFWIESLRIDELGKSTQWISLFGQEWRLNMWAALFTFVLAVVMLVVLFLRRPRTAEAVAEELEVYRAGHGTRTVGSAQDIDPDVDGDAPEDSDRESVEDADHDAEESTVADQSPDGETSTGPDAETPEEDAAAQEGGASDETAVSAGEDPSEATDERR